MDAWLHVVCPHCRATNRLPALKLHHQPKCGRCHRALFTGMPLSLDTTGFEHYLGQEQLPLVVDFWADWCGPCKMMAPAFAQAAAVLEPEFRLLKVNTDQQPALSTRFNIRSIPTLIVFRNGRELARQSGALTLQAMLRWIKAVGR